MMRCAMMIAILFSYLPNVGAGCAERENLIRWNLANRQEKKSGAFWPEAPKPF